MLGGAPEVGARAAALGGDEIGKGLGKASPLRVFARLCVAFFVSFESFCDFQLFWQSCVR